MVLVARRPFKGQAQWRRLKAKMTELGLTNWRSYYVMRERSTVRAQYRWLADYGNVPVLVNIIVFHCPRCPDHAWAAMMHGPVIMEVKYYHTKDAPWEIAISVLPSR